AHSKSLSLFSHGDDGVAHVAAARRRHHGVSLDVVRHGRAHDLLHECARGVEAGARDAGHGPMSMRASAAAGPAIVVYAQRERARALVRASFPRRKARVVLTRTVRDFDAAFKANLVDAALVDVGSAHEETWRVASRAREFPSIPFFGVAALRAAEGPALAQCAAYAFTDVLVD